MKKFQKETEDALNRNMDSLRKQLDDDARAKDQLLRENRHLEDKLRQMAGTIADLEAQVQSSYINFPG